ncbi:MAG: hypothetical protein HKP18_04260 [Acidimicrobiia bacterium]|nr:hypothetical protein [Acidimicrobiia bacterium]
MRRFATLVFVAGLIFASTAQIAHAAGSLPDESPGIPDTMVTSTLDVDGLHLAAKILALTSHVSVIPDWERKCFANWNALTEWQEDVEDYNDALDLYGALLVEYEELVDEYEARLFANELAIALGFPLPYPDLPDTLEEWLVENGFDPGFSAPTDPGPFHEAYPEMVPICEGRLDVETFLPVAGTPVFIPIDVAYPQCPSGYVLGWFGYVMFVPPISTRPADWTPTAPIGFRWVNQAREAGVFPDGGGFIYVEPTQTPWVFQPDPFFSFSAASCVEIFDAEPGDFVNLLDLTPDPVFTSNPSTRGVAGVETWLWYDATDPADREAGPLTGTITAKGIDWTGTAWAWVHSVDWDLDYDPIFGEPPNYPPTWSTASNCQEPVPPWWGYFDEGTTFPDSCIGPAEPGDAITAGGSEDELNAAAIYMYEENKSNEVLTGVTWRGVWVDEFGGWHYYTPVMKYEITGYPIDEIVSRITGTGDDG